METSFEQFGPLMLEQLREQTGNLLAAVQLITPVIREQREARYDQYLAIMNQSLYRLLRLTQNVEFTALSGEDSVLREGALDLAGLCWEICRQVAPLAELVGVEFRWEEEPASLLTTGDGVLLRRMLLNLISNAIRAAGQDGAAGLRLTSRKGSALITIWDSGPGISMEGPDFDSLTVRPDGAGLGLLVARRVALMHGGILVFQQQAGRGGRAAVSLPLHPPKSGTALRTPAAGYDVTGGFSPVLVELSSVLPSDAFLPQDLDP